MLHYDPNQISNKQKSSLRKEGHILSQLQLLVYKKSNTSKMKKGLNSKCYMEHFNNQLINCYATKRNTDS